MFKHKRTLPSEYRKIKIGEKRIIRTFMKVELDERNEEKEALYGRGIK